MKDLLVMKFGGTSVGSADRMRVAARLSAEKKRKRPVIIVVSAMSALLLPWATQSRTSASRGVRPSASNGTAESKFGLKPALLTASRRRLPHPDEAGLRTLARAISR